MAGDGGSSKCGMDTITFQRSCDLKYKRGAERSE